MFFATTGQVSLLFPSPEPTCLSDARSKKMRKNVLCSSKNILTWHIHMSFLIYDIRDCNYEGDT